MVKRGDRGFSLIEVLVVMVVLGIVATMSVTALVGALDRAKQRATMSDMRTVSRALEAYAVDNSYMPGHAGGLPQLVDDLVPYAVSVLPLADHWGHEIRYTKDPSGNYSVESYGKDGVDGLDIDEANRMDFTRDIVIFNGLFVAAPQ